MLCFVWSLEWSISLLWTKHVSPMIHYGLSMCPLWSGPTWINKQLMLWFVLHFRFFDAIMHFLLLWWYCTLVLRESILQHNGSRLVHLLFLSSMVGYCTLVLRESILQHNGSRLVHLLFLSSMVVLYTGVKGKHSATQWIKVSASSIS